MKLQKQVFVIDGATNRNSSRFFARRGLIQNDFRFGEGGTANENPTLSGFSTTGMIVNNDFRWREGGMQSLESDERMIFERNEMGEMKI